MIKNIIKESRPPTLFVGLLSTVLGIILAYRNNFFSESLGWNLWIIFLVVLAAILLQSAINLMNNYFEEDVSEELLSKRQDCFLGYKRSYEEIFTFKTGIIFFIITALIGFYLSYYVGKQLLIIEFVGIFAAYSYSGEPFNYKKFGIGSIMSFIMMGPLLAYASYYVFSSAFSIEPILYSFTNGLFIPAILIANEIRDYEEDSRRKIRTLTVRIGYKNGIIIYYLLIIFTYIDTLLFVFLGYMPKWCLIVLATIPFIKNIKEYIDTQKHKLVPFTAKFYMIFSVVLYIILIFTK
ncbi:prenyltransferase [Clostridium sp. C2-6-12]|uniref:prenyltransferase n=1 Tax=Clostridium sp. C2-6-12 TaxID=2698832 RepID=UPI00136887E3|nr:prenyltransferase [Clostridium sp. C2-6-12]